MEALLSAVSLRAADGNGSWDGWRRSEKRCINNDFTCKKAEDEEKQQFHPF